VKNFLEKVNIKKGDSVLVSSDILGILLRAKKEEQIIDPNKIIDTLIEKVGKNGNLLFPTYNWDFCKGKGFHYKDTLSLSGALGNTALKRKDFIRTKNPIYSFAVTGKDKKLLCDIDHESCFSLDSPFGFLIKKNGKNLFIGMDYKDGFTFCHVAEEKVGVYYRFFKSFTGPYIGPKEKKIKKTVKMYVRDPKSNVLMTLIHKDFDNELMKHNAINKTTFMKTQLTLIDINKAYELMVSDIMNGSKIIHLKKNEF